MAVRIQVLGSLRVWLAGTEIELGPPGRRAVLGLLVLAGGEAMSKQELVDALWGGRPPRSAVNVLQTHVKHLRRLLEPDRPARSGSEILPHAGGGYAVRWDAVEIDLPHVRGLVTEANDALRDGETGRAAALFGEALRWWRGRPLADIPSLATHPKVLALQAERRALLARYGDAMLAIGAADEVLAELAEAAADQPLDEPAQARLIRAYHGAGQRATAFRLYQEVRQRLVEELGVEPGPELAAAHAALLEDGEPLPAPRSTARVPRQLPAEPSGFTGRAAELSILDQLVPRTGSSGGAVALVAVTGPAGAGKTALAVHWGHRVKDRFPDGQFYANLRGHSAGAPATALEVLTRFLAALDVPAERLPADTETASALYRTLMTDRKALVVLDNAVDVDQVRPLLPAGPGCLVLVTARDRMAGLVALHGARRLTLGMLEPGEALDLLARVLGPEWVRAEREAAAEVAGLCAYLPLALRIAAANLAEGGIEDYVIALRKGNLLGALTVPGDEQIAVRTAFDLSYAALPAETRRLFRLLSLVPGNDIGVEAVEILTGEERAGPMLDTLASAHLVEQHAPGRYHFHDLLRRYAADRLRESPAETGSARRRLHEWYLRGADQAAKIVYPHMFRMPLSVPDGPVPAAAKENAAEWLETELGNLVAVVEDAPGPVAWLLADSLRGYFWLSSRQVEWRAAAGAALAAAEEDGDLRARVSARFSLADLGFRQGRYREAVRHHTGALMLARRAGWVEAQAAVLGNLGCVYWQSGRLPAAAVRFSRGLELSRRAGSPAGEAVALGNLGLVHWEMGDLAGAAGHYVRALRRYRGIGSRYGEAINLSNLGQVQHARGRVSEAAGLLAKALALHREAGNRAGEAETLGRLASVYCDLGRLTDALDHAREGLRLARETGEPRGEGEALVALAGVHQRVGHRQDAVRRYRQALALLRESGDRYPEIDALIGLATATGDLGQARRALALAERAGYGALRKQAAAAIEAILRA
ncbi:BTAD domain-containing putative transcriptional regulator [Amycolatopsis roodepoortensis]|uniref:DNA-binding SARP family transcriptional activator/Tfp pilus assembly protein PilF n=1 Tax=Amycolatopsis roodepoortensis TaxID=700274 RepID=A0ABR9L750_9PSEU|nr:BTAD domain-containing putative transcriptional regulator [Amycolatopsis roodepoortensis]MBE1576375.1 DNA-binding SARP family transcriptional activator/Tfp pilus assembly protein PilF [Amycolatopsis roodepoortensis]